MIFADPPYFLSNGGISLQSGKVVCVDKGEWDKGLSQADMTAFNKEWLRLCRDKLKDNGTRWISGTYHNIFYAASCRSETFTVGYPRQQVMSFLEKISFSRQKKEGKWLSCLIFIAFRARFCRQLFTFAATYFYFVCLTIG